SLQEALAGLHSVDLRFELASDGARLSCSDTGVGMTRSIIEDGLLVTGRGRRREVLELERRCAEENIRLERTGRFGIGVLSYVMLATRVTVTKGRSQESGVAEATGWRFEVDGVDGFGELRQDSTLRRGTEVRLHLHSDAVLDDPAAFYRDLRRYLVS